ncbi:MAG: hypothetical protein ABJA74_09690 [Lapillicoccus sp.]
MAPRGRAAMVHDAALRRVQRDLVRLSKLGQVTRDELAEVVEDAWLARAPKRLAKEWLAAQWAHGAAGGAHGAAGGAHGAAGEG